jgi:hypothetical protein
VAQEIWMPVPRVEAALDGLLVQGHLEGRSFSGAAWIAHGSPGRELGRDEVGVGSVQLEDRTFRGQRLDVLAGEAIEALPALGPVSPALAVELRTP